MKLIRTLLSLAGVSLLATSCASFSGNKLPQVADTPATNVKKIPLTYTMTSGRGNTGGARTETPAGTSTHFAKPMVDAFNKSERFSSVSQGKGGAVHVDVDVLNHGNAGVAFASGFISGFSLFTIPGFGTDHFKLTATARTSSGKSRQYILEDSMTTAFWLPLIVAAPFASPTSVYPKVHENMYRNLMLNMERDGILPKAGN
ncbi:hypothetical protein OKA05_14735 [Luteolibacter arcticus]|uniref:Lipoprotein n=1 Tax=Luteolibacter arcticus TaxID=1581411 RepID=A0ABT3GK00_9BACT|nr:hypothetical protein [Luteolibacter arcticus]MCW1923821.1 hypothetical protein [Luteolibacter arcticus]